MMRYRVVASAAVVVLLQGCGEKEQPQAPVAPAPQSQAVTPPQTVPVETATDARAVRQPEAASAPPPPAALVAPTAPAATASQSLSGTGLLLKESELKERPFIDAATVAKLAAQSKVTIRERSGGWYRVESSGKSGWVRMLNVKVSEGAASLGASSELQQAASLATGRAGSGNVVSTSGLRGLDEEQLTSAKPDYAQLDKLDGYGVSREAAAGYAQQNGLKPRSVGYLPAPK